MAEPRVFLRQKWSRYLGELRPIHDIYVGNEIFPSPTPSVTPPVTPTSTPLVTPTNTPSVTQTSTQTNTPSVTQTNTPSVTIGLTPTMTPSNSPTPSITPSITPNPVCPEEFVVTNSTTGFFDNGTYQRQYSTSGQSMNYGYIFWTGVTRYFVPGTAPDGNNYAVFQYYDGGDYNLVAPRFGTGFGGNAFNSWISQEQSTSLLTSGSTWVGGSADIGTGSTIFSGVRYPSAGQKTGGYITYPLVCPTTTPTPSNTATPSLTPTNTNTPSVTPSVTMTNTPSITPYPVCPEELYFEALFSQAADTTGTYTRLRTYTGGTFSYGYVNDNPSISADFQADQLLSGDAFAVYGRSSGSTYYTMVRRGLASPQAWKVFVSTGDYVINNPLYYSGLQFNTSSGILSDSIYFPPAGFGLVNNSYLNYPSVCPTSTPTNTTTPSVTPSVTPTMNPLCPEELNYTTTFTAMTGADGSYQRLYSYTGGTFNFGYQTGTTFFTGSISGENYVVFGRNDGTNFYSIIAFFVGSTFNYFLIQKSTGNYRHNGGTPVTSNNIGTTTDYEEISGVRVPKRGLYSTGSGNQYISYPSSCPTATPTSTLTQTPSSTPQVSPTSTPTMTNTQTSTPTNTPSITPSTSPPSCSVNMTVDNNTTGGGVDITGIEINGTPVTYVSGDNFSVLPGELGTFSTSITGVSVTMVVFYDASNANHAINVTDCDVNSFCCDNLTNGVGSCTFEGLAIDCTCTNGIQIIANNGDCL